MDEEQNFKNLDFCEIFHIGRKRKLPLNEQLSTCITEIEQKSKRRLTDNGRNEMMKPLRNLNKLYNRYLDQYSRGHSKVIKYRSSWVNKDVIIPNQHFVQPNIETTLEDPSVSNYEPQPSTSSGIPRDKSFSDYAERHQRNIVREFGDTIKDPDQHFVQPETTLEDLSVSDYEPQPSTSSGIPRDKSFSDYAERHQRNIVREFGDTIKDPDQHFVQPETTLEDLSVSDYEPQPSTSSGIPRDKSFSDYAERHQRNIVREFADTIKDPEVALRTARLLAKNKGDKVLSKKITEIIKLNKTNENEKKSSGVSRINPDRYLAHMTYTGMSKHGHRDQMQMFNNENGTKVVPGYEKILEAKKRCYPKVIEVTHKKASIPLKELLCISIQRLYEAYKDDIEEAASKIPSNDENFIKTELLVMWGMDGTTGLSQYNQANSKDDGEIMNDSSLMTVSMTMLKLVHREEEGDKQKITTIWENESPQSTHSCRPILLEFEKESEEYIKKTKKNIDEQIEDLPTYLLKMQNGQNLAISFRFYFTMIDGKVLNVVTETRSAQRCPICGATPTQMKDMEMIGKFKPKENVLEYGIQPMHSTMNTVKNLYKISYREEINKHQIRAEADKIKFMATKKKVQERMRDAFHVRIDEPRAGGAGTSDTAAVARKLLKEPEKLAETLHLDKEVVKRISVVMNAICCGEKLDPKKFGDYCKETYKKYLSVYSWYPPCPSLHKVLEHSKDVIIILPMALGKMAEEGGESKNKLLVKYREHHTRKTSRAHTLTDMIHGLLVHSDPVISQEYLKSRPRKAKRIEDLSPEVQQLLLNPNEECEDGEEREDTYTDGEMERNFFSLLMDEEESIFWGQDFEDDEEHDEDYEQSESEDFTSNTENESSPP